MSADDGLDVLIDDSDPKWAQNRRRILIDISSTGHADVLREAVDGLRGNDPD